MLSAISGIRFAVYVNIGALHSHRNFAPISSKYVIAANLFFRSFIGFPTLMVSNILFLVGVYSIVSKSSDKISLPSFLYQPDPLF